ncbi:c-type cytochrome [bacterium]|nr:c-type cytochrome [bacterium]MBU1994581.1 c-type cytochrome [bacterium]
MRLLLLILLLSVLCDAEVPHAMQVNSDEDLKYALFLKNPILYKEQIHQEGKALFLKRCSYCHGKDGSGQGGFAADLRRRISKESAYYTIKNGGNNFRGSFAGGMPPMIKDNSKAQSVAQYISLGMPKSHPGALVYQQTNCARCHGESGHGRKYLAPNIHNFDLKTITMILKNGKNGYIGLMQSFNYLSDEEIQIIAIYTLSLSHSHLVGE